MGFTEFFNEHKKIIIVILILIVAFIIYRYFWENKSVTNDLDISTIEQRLQNLEANLGLNKNHQSNTPFVF